MIKQGLENIVVPGKIEGKRGRGRPRLKCLRRLSQLMHHCIIKKVHNMKKVENHDRLHLN